ncbi:unnamed protein product [Allacma fusca]|uniref:Uncharacterized protein n=1 Tax=Allacma fusca TaxID=39272 RepID=A0A8J2KR79_9HEXA|nr:unnamed protein product [Allacma fusca]
MKYSLKKELPQNFQQSFIFCTIHVKIITNKKKTNKNRNENYYGFVIGVQLGLGFFEVDSTRGLSVLHGSVSKEMFYLPAADNDNSEVKSLGHPLLDGSAFQNFGPCAKLSHSSDVPRYSNETYFTGSSPKLNEIV